jgi:hypothetical protein
MKRVLLVSLLVVSLARAADPATKEPDPWTGKPRAEVVQLLGEPDKAKTARDRRETLTYTFHRIPTDAPADPELITLHVPGVGFVARVPRGGPPDAVGIGPPEYDQSGRPTSGGGRTQSSSASSSYDTKTGKMTTTSSESGNPQVAAKVKLQLVVGADGHVESWSVSGK